MNIKHAFSGFSTYDLKKTEEFYGQTLGLKAEQDKDMGLVKIKLTGGGEVMIYPKDNHQAATYTVLNLVVDNIDSAVDDLGGKGIKFEMYEGFGQDAKGIARSSEQNPGPNIAWFKDPAGNILAIIEDKS